MARYRNNFITQVLIRADLVRGSFPLEAYPGEELLALCADYPVRQSLTRNKNEVRIQKTPQGPVKDTRSYSFPEHNFWTGDKGRRIAVSREYVFLEWKNYEDFASMRDAFLEIMETISEQHPELKIARLGMRYINEIKLPGAEHGPGLGAEFWKDYVNELLLGGLRFAANDGALSRQMNSIELNYGTDRATVKYGVFNAEYPKPNRRREFILDVDTFCQQLLTPEQVPARLEEFHRAACSVFETAVTDKLRAVMDRA